MALSKQLKDKLRPEIVRVLKAAAKGKGAMPKYLNAYQILQRIKPDSLRNELIDAQETSKVGKRAGKHSTAASDVGKIAGFIDGVVSDVHIDTGGMEFFFGTTRVEAGNVVARLYRWEGP